MSGVTERYRALLAAGELKPDPDQEKAVAVLGRIAASKREELRSRFAGVSIDALRAAAVPTSRKLTSALARPGSRFVLEIKKASPSAGAIGCSWRQVPSC